jgi:hypothetical protein
LKPALEGEEGRLFKETGDRMPPQVETAMEGGNKSNRAAIEVEAFERNPKAYLATVEPTRCFHTAEPGAEVPFLESKTAGRGNVTAGGAVPLWVRTVPNAPVTFTAFDGGEFKENGLSSVTVQADGRGMAVANFVATDKVAGELTVIAGSPLASGTQRFSLRVVAP